MFLQRIVLAGDWKARSIMPLIWLSRFNWLSHVGRLAVIRGSSLRVIWIALPRLGACCQRATQRASSNNIIFAVTLRSAKKSIAAVDFDCNKFQYYIFYNFLVTEYEVLDKMFSRTYISLQIKNSKKQLYNNNNVYL